MANQKNRTMKVYAQSGYHYQATQTIQLKGKWLGQLGFGIGDYIQVSCEDGKIVITPDAERTKLSAEEAAFMERKTKALQKRFEKEKAGLHAQFVAEKATVYGQTSLVCEEVQ